MMHKSITEVSCGDDYTAIVSQFGELFVCGNQEDGKLGLGDAYKYGVQLFFTQVAIPAVTYVHCGPSHMAAITEFVEDNESKNGTSYAWGRNSRGQLGIGSKEDKNSPTQILFTKEMFTKIVCGQNFTIGLSKNEQLYAWGNRKYTG